jgi:hypothetical protein
MFRKPSDRTIVERADGRTLRRLQIYFDQEVATRIKHYCVDLNIDMSSFVSSAMDETLSRLGRPREGG